MRRIMFAWGFAATGCIHAQNTVTHFEYWFDQHDAWRTTVAVPLPAQEISLPNGMVDVSALTVGPHRIHYRLRDEQGQWSGVLHRDLMRLTGGPFHIVGFEYWFDGDDAIGQRTYMDLEPPTLHTDLTIDIALMDVPVGAHRIHYRLRDAHGAWSGVLHHDLRRNHDGPYEVVRMRYWSDTSALLDLTEVPITPSVRYLDIIDHLLFCNWSMSGTTAPVYFQLKDRHGQWSSVVSRSIDVDLVTQPPDRPGPIDGPDQLQSGEATYAVEQVPGAGYYEWTLPEGWTGSSTSHSIAITAAGSGAEVVELSVVAVNGCGASDARVKVVNMNGVGLADAKGESGPGLFPNPTSGPFTLALDAPALVAIIDATGREVVAAQRIVEPRFPFDLTGAAAGLYVVRIWQDGTLRNLRLNLCH